MSLESYDATVMVTAHTLTQEFGKMKALVGSLYYCVSEEIDSN